MNDEQLRAALLDLAPAKAIAAEALATGSTHAAAADAAGVTRETVTRWAGHHPGFRAALDLYRATLAAETAETARRLRRKALDAAEAALDAGTLDPLALLRAVPEPPTSVPSSPLTAAELLDAALNRTRVNLPPRPYRLEDQLADPDGTRHATHVTLARLADAAGLDRKATR